MEDNHQGEDSQMADLGSRVSSPPSSNHRDVEMQHDNQDVRSMTPDLFLKTLKLAEREFYCFTTAVEIIN
jgi:hypothetical protein